MKIGLQAVQGRDHPVGRKLIRMAGWTLTVLVILVTALVLHLYLEGRPTQGRPQYVAMGSSFAAGPAITEEAENSPWFCARSRDNYAHQLARLRGLSLVDVSCGGATTKDILEGGRALQPAQIEAVTGETELVTVTIGGNDIGYLANLMAMGCDDGTPWYVRSMGGCTTRSMAAMEQALPKLLNQLVAIIDEVHRRAPAAQVVLVNYQTVLPESGTCERLGLSEAQVARMRDIAGQLSEVTYAAAQGHGALLMDAGRITRGHDACAEVPWMNGMHPPGGLMGAPLHPSVEGMTAVAQGLNALLGEPQRTSN
ncbi:SGNH/GDSL hydrolase family protein [Solimonas sp. K1W22B-7]|uniref:SGNH/GDSL hydrolase family protein n=1 Tax=Solimonas sp. K1W22B-7 TaxID=2303331 RepID=UPI000E32DA6B|nr:SGNH/GDSL hydrolase family protein [Solimonas sp. K1W22B-7]AXQ27823.1 SGNH/GDSL hydrolase family protein [Solimonas sp. K1W22B-7]